MSQSSPLLMRRPDASASVPAAEMFFQSIAGRLRARMVNRTASDVPIRVSGVEVRTLGDLFDEPEFSEGGITGPLWVGSARLPGAVLLQHTLLSRLIAVLLGEGMDDNDSPAQLRALSPVERRIAGRLCADLLAEAAACWPDSTAPRVSMGTLTASGRPRDPAISTVSVYCATMDFGPVDAPLGLLTLALPLQSLGNLATDEPIVEEPEARPARTDLSRMLPMEVDVLVELCSLRMTLKRLKTLQPGDILPLGNRDALIRVNGLPMFEGEAGTRNGFQSIRVLRRTSS